MNMLATAVNPIDATISESFEKNLMDGFWYPVEPGTPLVRIQVANSGYQIQRRRNAQSPWMPIVTAELPEFDPDGFRQWRSRWPMTV